MGFVNFNNQQSPEAVTYTKEMVRMALLETETKSVAKAERLVANLNEEVTLNEALALFSSPIIAMPALAKALNEASFEVHYSDGIRAFKKFSSEAQALAYAKDLIKNKSGLRFVDVFKAGSGFHSTADTDAIVAFWGEGSYTDNVSKKDAKLAAKKIEESAPITEAKKFKVGDKWEWKHVDGNKTVEITGIQPNGDVMAMIVGTPDQFILREPNKYLKKKVNESVNEGAVKQFEMDYKEMETSIKRGIGWIDPDHAEYTWDVSSDAIDFELVKTEIYKRLIAAGLLWTTDHTGEEKGKQIKSLRELGLKESLITEGQFSWMTQDTGQQIGSERENTITVYMFDNKGTKWKETKYDGYGRFGGKDYYELLAQMNGVENADRQDGINLAFDKNKVKAGKVLFPALVTDPKFNWKKHDFTEEAEHDPNQSWYVEQDDDDYGLDIEESVVFEATVEMDAMDPDNKDFLKFLKKHKVKITDKKMEGPGGGTPVITMQGSRKDLEKVLADEEFGWADPDLAEYIEEAVVTEARSIKKIEKDYSQTVADMKATVDQWKAAEEGELKTSLLDKLKALTTKKRQLEAEMDDAVSLKDIDAELVASESITLSKAEKWMQLSEKLNRRLNEDLRADLKKYIKANQKELNSLADADNWDAIHNMLRTDFNVDEGSKEEDELFTTFNFVF